MVVEGKLSCHSACSSSVSSSSSLDRQEMMLQSQRNGMCCDSVHLIRVPKMEERVDGYSYFDSGIQENDNKIILCAGFVPRKFHMSLTEEKWNSFYRDLV